MLSGHLVLKMIQVLCMYSAVHTILTLKWKALQSCALNEDTVLSGYKDAPEKQMC